MRLRVAAFSVLFALVVCLAAGQVAAQVATPVDLRGELDGVPYRIVVPATWNGTLLVFAHGYNETQIPPPVVPQAADEAVLLGEGFALAASRFAGSVPMPGMPTQAGWTVKNALQNIVALTTAFNDMVARPQRTIVWGKSMGGLITLGAIEKFPGLFDGAVALCAPASGTPRLADQRLDFTLAYAVAFGWEDAWGTPGDIRDDLDITTTIIPDAQNQLAPAKKGLWEFVRLVNGIPYDSSFYGPVNYRLTTLYMAVMQRLDLDRRAGGHVAENIGRTYTLSPEEKSYLQTQFGLNPDSLLDAMNAETIYASDRNARNYAEHYVDPNGRIRRPVLTLHTTGDALATPNHESAYRAAVEAQGQGDLLLQQFSTGNGAVNTHCTFRPAQEVAAIHAMMFWLDTGDRPPAATFFPATAGFDPAFVPLPWRW